MQPLLESLFVSVTRRLLEAGALLASLASLASLVLEWGFPLSNAARDELHLVDLGILLFFLVQLLARLLIAPARLAYLRVFKYEYLLGFLLCLVLGWSLWLGDATDTSNASLATKLYLGSTQLLVAFFMVLAFARASRFLSRLRLQPSRLVAATFAGAILLGTALLLLPNAVATELSLVDAFFLSTSAVCVTGLSPVDIQLTLTTSGQLILLLLIQAGGLGIMTLAGGIGILFGGIGGMKQRVLLKDIMGAEGLERLRDLLTRILVLSLGIELLGAVWLWFAWQDQQPDAMLRAWWAVFHSVSAFCNAGFSIIPGGLANPGFAGSAMALSGIAVLVAAGGTGCLVLHEIGARCLGRARLSLASSMVLRAHLALFVLGALALWCTEELGGRWSGQVEQPWLAAAFMGIMPRTAGFQTLDLVSLAPSSLFVMILLMVVGGAPGSTAGGIKVTSVLAIAAYLRALVRGQDFIRLGRRELSQETCLRAMTLLLVYGSLLVTATTLLLLQEDIELLPALFEVVSALSTVGLSLNLTPTLGDNSKWLLIACMFVGRLGFITVLWALFQRQADTRVRLPRENLPLF